MEMTANGEKSLKVLAVIATPSRIHYEWIRTLIVALAKRGHKITMISPERETERIENVETIWIENLQNEMPARRNLDKPPRDFTLREITKIYNFGVSICDKAMRSRGVEELMMLKKNSFDLIIMDVAGSQSFYGFVKHFENPPVVGFSAFGNPPWISDVVGAGSEPFQVPHAAVSYTNRMNYQQRCWNSFLYLFTRFYRRYFVMPRMKSIMERYFEDPDDPVEIERNFDFLLVNADSVIDYPQSWPPSLIPVAGLQLNPPDPNLNNKDLQSFFENSSHGVVYISLGNRIRLNDIKLKSLLSALCKLEENVLWHLPDENLPETPGNVKIFKNLPHNDVLGHQKIRVFFSPGGGLSLQESVYHGVPLICLPLSSNDQFNARRSISLEVGVALDYSEFTEETIFHCLRRVLDDPRYSENAKKLSERFRDQPTRPLERAIFWTEYAARNSGFHHLRLPAGEMTWFQTSMVDIAFGYLAIIFLVCFFFFTATKSVLRYFLAVEIQY